MLKFSANLGFLWSDLSLPQAIHAAKQAGFDAIECHWPYDTPIAEVKQALDETGLPMMSLNTVKGPQAAGGFGLTAVPGFELEARTAIDQAIYYAKATNTINIHVMAGLLNLEKFTVEQAQEVFIKNVTYATKQAQAHNIQILIEPINTYDVPNYFLSNLQTAVEIIHQVGADNLKLMFDCYHLARMDEDVIEKLSALKPIIGHIQFASVPERGPPDLVPDRNKILDYNQVFKHIIKIKYNLPIGAEYLIKYGSTLTSLDWLGRVGSMSDS